MLQPQGDEHFMRMALREAEQAFEADEIPVGAIIVAKGTVIARGHNLTERLNDFTAHAEMQAFTAASEYLGGKYLDQCTLYVTLEPCPMCAGAAFWTRIGKVVYGAPDLKRGFSRMQEQLKHDHVLHPKTEVVSGVLEEECAAILKEFFAKKRRQKL
ncbi:MAG: nucleoside deaminase [Flavobacteriales bacterium]|nr:nucleoside deaminase [Flavobacteriales bacterium]MDG1779365.1 nucleoside deaminase [Flavobacteriales bacterium]MDG2245168.1 nucleoside deaminase [Flavobacteriales bacterium]